MHRYSLVSSKLLHPRFYFPIPTSDMCEAHKNIGGVAVAERTPVKKIKTAERGHADAVRDAIAGLIGKFGYDVIRKALDQQDPNAQK